MSTHRGYKYVPAAQRALLKDMVLVALQPDLAIWYWWPDEMPQFASLGMGMWLAAAKTTIPRRGTLCMMTNEHRGLCILRTMMFAQRPK